MCVAQVLDLITGVLHVSVYETMHFSTKLKAAAPNYNEKKPEQCLRFPTMHS